MKILFIAFGQESFATEYLSAALKKEGHEVKLHFNPNVGNFIGFLSVDFLTKISDEKILLKTIREFKPDLIGISCLTNFYSLATKNAQIIKKHFDIPIVIGGIHPTSLPEYVIENNNFDMLCIGEGEEALVELVNKMQNKDDIYNTKNFWFRRNGNIIKNEVRPLTQDLDSLPFPDRELFYQYGFFLGTLYFLSGRGCPFKCSYCCHNLLQRKYAGSGAYVRKRNVDNVLDEVKICLDKYKVKALHPYDDLFVVDKQWVHEFSEKCCRITNLPLYCHVRPGTFDRKILSALVQANCTTVFYGIDSGSFYIRSNILNRDIKDEMIYADTRLLKEFKIRICASAIFCLPDETEEQMFETIEMMKKIKVDELYTYIFYPFPNTDAYNSCIKKGLIDNEIIGKIKNGEGSYHRKPLIKSKYGKKAQIFKNVAPLYVKYPFSKPLLNFLLKKDRIIISEIIFFLTVPFLYFAFGRARIKEFLSTAKAFLFLKLKGYMSGF